MTDKFALLQWDFNVPDSERITFEGTEQECQQKFQFMLKNSPDNIDGFVFTPRQAASWKVEQDSFKTLTINEV